MAEAAGGGGGGAACFCLALYIWVLHASKPQHPSTSQQHEAVVVVVFSAAPSCWPEGRRRQGHEACEENVIIERRRSFPRRQFQTAVAVEHSALVDAKDRKKNYFFSQQIPNLDVF